MSNKVHQIGVKHAFRFCTQLLAIRLARATARTCLTTVLDFLVIIGCITHLRISVCASYSFNIRIAKTSISTNENTLNDVIKNLLAQVKSEKVFVKKQVKLMYHWWR